MSSPRPKQIAQSAALAGSVMEWNGSTWVPSVLYIGDTGWFGDGSDGDVTISTTVTILRDMFYNNLTVTGTGILVVGAGTGVGGYRIRVKGVLTVQTGGVIRNNGDPGTNFTGGTNGGAVANNNPGGSGGTGNTGAGGAGAANNLSGLGGAGGAGGTGAGGAGGGINVQGADRGTHLMAIFGWQGARNGSQNWLSVIPSAGGGGGGGDGVNRGGGGGAGGGAMRIAAKSLVVESGGFIQANGGAGATRTVGNVGGGGGGSGGWMTLIYRTLSNLGTIEVAGGAGGAGVGTGVAGSAGSAGTLSQYVTAV